MNTITLDQAIDFVTQLPLEQREMLIDIVRHRDIDNRRKEIARDARDSIAAFQAGQLKPQPLPEILTSLRQSLNDPDDV